MNHGVVHERSLPSYSLYLIRIIEGSTVKIQLIGRGSYPKAKQGQGLQRTKKPIYPYEVEPVALLPAELKPTSKERQPFIVADTETVLIKNVHVPYAAGLLVVKPGEDVGAKPDYSIETYFSEDHTFIIPEFEERSNRMLFDFLERLAVVASETKIRKLLKIRWYSFNEILCFSWG